MNLFFLFDSDFFIATINESKLLISNSLKPKERV